MKKKWNYATEKDMKDICPSFGGVGADRCPYFFPFKDISKVGTKEYASGIWVPKKGLEGKECILADLCAG